MKWTSVVLVLCTAILIPDAWAQRSSASPGSAVGSGQDTRPDILGLQDLSKRAATPQDAALALDHPVDPETYVLGPGDVLAVSIRGGLGSVQPATVSPEGNLLVPQLPMLHVGGLTLAAAIDSIRSAWRSSLPDTPVDVTLTDMRRMRVSVGGAVQQPGQFVVTPADRALTLVDLAGGFADSASHRRATLVHSDGQREPVDALRYLRSGDLTANPRLTAGSHLIVEPMRELQHRVIVEVDGGVTFPGSYEWLAGDRLRDVLHVAGGLFQSTGDDSVEITRFSATGYDTSVLPLGMLRNGRGPAVEPGDLIRVRIDPARSPERATVDVRGEVHRPGRYPVVEGETRLLDVIERAGGLTDRASLRGARIWRMIDGSSARTREVQRIDSTEVDILSRFEIQFVRDYKRSLDRDMLPVDFARLFDGTEKEREANNLRMEDSLVVMIPEQVHHVLVMGAVAAPGYYDYQPGWDYKDYVEAAGDFLKEGDKRQTRHIPYQTSQMLLARNDLEILPGDILFVPERYVPDFWTTFREYFSVFLQAATLGLLIATST